MPAGRFAPSPSGDLHVGNLRTAVIAWLLARSTGRRFLVRMEDLDRVSPGADQQQLTDLAALGLDWDGPMLRQSDRATAYDDAMALLEQSGLTYECFCTRREIREATSAPHATPGIYPGTCRDLDPARREEHRREGRPPALRLRAQTRTLTVTDNHAGPFTGDVDDVVLRRNDGVAAYNLAVVVDDAAQGIDQVVRGDDLLASTPRQVHLADLLQLPVPAYWHVPLALNTRGDRLAKRDGAVTLAELSRRGRTAQQVLGVIAESLGLATPAEPVTMPMLLERLDPETLPRQPWTVDPDQL